MSNQSRSEITRTRATVRRSWWPGWIWAIPIAVLLLLGWWGARVFFRGGEDITVSFDDVHGLKPSNSTVVYRGINIGKVGKIALAKNGSSVDVTVRIDDDATKFLTSGTQFWLRGATPSLSDPASLASVLSGPTIVMEPGPGEKATHFVGLTHKPVLAGPHGQPQIYGVSLKGSVGGLKQGEPVKLRGFPVGEVKDVGFRYDANSGDLATPVTLALYPSLFHIEGAAAPDSGDALAAAIDRLVQQGLRARLERDPPLVGNPQVTLDIVPDASKAALAVVDGVPQIPTQPGGGVNSIIDRINKLPIEQIAQNVLDTTHKVDALVSSPRLDDAIAELDATLKQVRQTADSAGPKITSLVDGLRKTADQLDQAAKAAEGTARAARDTAGAANKLLGATPSQNDMQTAMSEITEAARSVRDLASYLDRHPEALIKGRSGE